MTIKTFEDLEIWQEGKRVAVDIFKLWQKTDSRGYYALQDQMQRAALSIPSNIAEGSERKSKAEYSRFLYISKGSAGELRTQLYVLGELGLVKPEVVSALLERSVVLSKRINSLITTLNNPNSR